MGVIRTGTVGYAYRDWAGVLYPVGTSMKRQLQFYLEQFDVCELTQFTHQIPEIERITQFQRQFQRSFSKKKFSLFIRLHQTLTHTLDFSLLPTICKHFKKAFAPFIQAQQFAGFVGCFPYAFKNSEESRDYLMQLDQALKLEDLPLFVDFRHPSWFAPATVAWLKQAGLSLVLVDEPLGPNLVPRLNEPTAKSVLVRFHGRNSAGWWSGNDTTRFDYLYSETELQEAAQFYEGLAQPSSQLSFVFQNHWQAQSVMNALQFKVNYQQEIAKNILVASAFDDDESQRPPTRLPLALIKSRVTEAIFSNETNQKKSTTQIDLPLSHEEYREEYHES